MSHINLTDTPDQIMQKVRNAKTDAEPLPATVDGLLNRPEARNLIGIYSALTNTDPAIVLSVFEGHGFGHFKIALAELLVETLRPISTRFTDLLTDSAELDRILSKGTERSREVAAPTFKAVVTAMGLA